MELEQNLTYIETDWTVGWNDRWRERERERSDSWVEELLVQSRWLRSEVGQF